MSPFITCLCFKPPYLRHLPVSHSSLSKRFPPHLPLVGTDTRPRCQLVWQWGFSPRPWGFRRRVGDPDCILSARSRARMGSDVGVQTPVYHRGSDPEMVFSARTRARMGSDVGVQTPVPYPPVPPSLGPPWVVSCAWPDLTLRYARHALTNRLPGQFGPRSCGDVNADQRLLLPVSCGFVCSCIRNPWRMNDDA